MQGIVVGDIFRTSYGSGPYQAVQILRGCTCPRYLDEINMDDPPLSSPHLHMVAVGVANDHNHGQEFYLGGYDEQTLHSVWDNDYLEIIERPAGVQLELGLLT